MRAKHSTGGRLDRLFDELQKETFDYFLHEANPNNGLILDKTRRGWPASIAAVGLALTAYPIGVERGFCKRAEAVQRTLNTLRFFAKSPQSQRPNATGYKGLFYHFLSMKTGERAWNCELSTVDSALLIAGMLIAAVYFHKNTPDEREIRELADSIYQAADWRWALGRKQTLSHGWKPTHGFLKPRWDGFSEALILYILGLGSPSHPLPIDCYEAWTADFEWKSIYGHDWLYAGPLFIHQLPHVWLDLAGIQDAVMRKRGSDYFQNSRIATMVQRQYAIENPRGFKEYGPECWGITASDGPGPAVRTIGGVRRRFYDYIARGAPFGPDDGTLAPWAVVSSLPFAPEIVIPSVEYMNDNLKLRVDNPYGFKATFNATFNGRTGKERPWVSKWHYGLNEGPIVIMIENYRTGMMRQLMRNCTHLVRGLRRAGFKGGWLG